jgi:hypothetical protein
MTNSAGHGAVACQWGRESDGCMSHAKGASDNGFLTDTVETTQITEPSGNRVDMAFDAMPEKSIG